MFDTTLPPKVAFVFPDGFRSFPTPDQAIDYLPDLVHTHALPPGFAQPSIYIRISRYTPTGRETFLWHKLSLTEKGIENAKRFIQGHTSPSDR